MSAKLTWVLGLSGAAVAGVGIWFALRRVRTEKAIEDIVITDDSTQTGRSLVFEPMSPTKTHRLPPEARQTPLTERKGLVNFLAGETPVGCEKHVVRSLGVELVLPLGWAKVEENAQFPVGDCTFAPIDGDAATSMVVSMEIEVLPELDMTIDEYHRFAWNRTNDTFAKDKTSNAFLTPPSAQDYTEGISPVVRCEMKDFGNHEPPIDRASTDKKPLLHHHILFFAAIDGTLAYGASVTYNDAASKAEKEKAEEIMHMVRRSLRTTLNHDASSTGQPNLLITSRRGRCEFTIPLSMYCFVEDRGAPEPSVVQPVKKAEDDDAQNAGPLPKVDMRCPFPGSCETVLGLTNSSEVIDGLTRLALLRVPSSALISGGGRASTTAAFTPTMSYVDAYRRLLEATPGLKIVEEEDQYNGLGLNRTIYTDHAPPISFFAEDEEEAGVNSALRETPRSKKPIGVGHAFVFPPMVPGSDHFIVIVIWVGWDGSYQMSPILSLIANVIQPPRLAWKLPDSRKGLGLRCCYELVEPPLEEERPTNNGSSKHRISTLLPIDIICKFSTTPLIARRNFGDSMVSVHAPYVPSAMPNFQITLIRDGRNGKQFIDDIRRQVSKQKDLPRPVKLLSPTCVTAPVDEESDSTCCVSEIVDAVVSRVVAVMTVVYGHGDYSAEELRDLAPAVRRLKNH